MLAIIKTGGKQYKVKKGDRIKVEKIKGQEGDKIIFSKVLLIGDEKKIVFGDPLIKNARVEGKILKQTRNPKVWGVKHKPKKRYKLKFGHKQPVTEVEILTIK